MGHRRSLTKGLRHEMKHLLGCFRTRIQTLVILGIMKGDNDGVTSIKSFNKYFLNHFTAWVARQSHGPFAIVNHVGRRSGKLYKTPIIPIPITNGFVAALTYGRDVDWYHNVMAAGQCEILWHGREYSVEKIEEIDTKDALAMYSQFERLILKRVGTKCFVKM